MSREVRFRPSAARLEEVTRHASYPAAVLGALQEGLIVSCEGQIVDVNDRFCEMTGFGRDELLGADMPWPFMPPETSERIGSLRQRLYQRGRGQHELSLVRADGSRFPVLASAGAARDENDEVLCWVLLLRDFSHHKQREERLLELASRDQLTGLLNKRSFLVSLAGEVARGRRYGHPVCLAILDLDGFKRTNDEQGHQAGDRVLAEVAGRLAALSRSGEHLARIGGDEFGWILPQTDARGATAAVMRARVAIATEAIRGVGSLTISGGICQSDGHLDAPQMYARADRALYSAKAAGGDTVWIY